jgi:voltage-gated potassium channel
MTQLAEAHRQAPNQGPSLARALAGDLLASLRLPLSLLAGVFSLGTVGFWLIGDGRWGWLDCAYMVSITLTGVGYGEILEPMTQQARLFAMGLMWTGVGVVLYAVSALTAFVVESRMSEIFRERKMEARLREMRGHYIVCGAGQVGRHVMREITATGRTLAVIDDDPARADWVRENLPQAGVVLGDATEEEVLAQAGLAAARGLIAALRDDSRNMLITVQARFANPQVKIGARCSQNNLVDKFYRAGADYVVNPDFIGGMRIASEMIRPQVVGFLDRMLRGKDPTVRVEEITLAAASELAGLTLGQAGLRERTGLAPIAVKLAQGEDFLYNPDPGLALEAGTVLIVIGAPGQTSLLKELCSGPGRNSQGR